MKHDAWMSFILLGQLGAVGLPGSALAEANPEDVRGLESKIAAQEKLVEQDPDDVKSARKLGGLYRQAKRWDKAFEVYEGLALKLGRQGATDALQAAMSKLRGGKAKAAAKYARKRLGRQDAVCKEWLMLAAFYRYARKPADEETAFLKAARLAPSSAAKADCLMRAAEAARKRGDADKALKHLDRAIASAGMKREDIVAKARKLKRRITTAKEKARDDK